MLFVLCVIWRQKLKTFLLFKAGLVLFLCVLFVALDCLFVCLFVICVHYLKNKINQYLPPFQSGSWVVSLCIICGFGLLVWLFVICVHYLKNKLNQSFLLFKAGLGLFLCPIKKKVLFFYVLFVVLDCLFVCLHVICVHIWRKNSLPSSFSKRVLGC